MSDPTDINTAHLAPETRERIAMGGEPGPGEVRHLTSCTRCRREIAEIGSLQVRLAALTPLAPSAGFADRVMARIRLPAPAWVRALDAIRAHRLQASAVAVTLIAAVTGMLGWLTAYPQLTPGTMVRLIWERSTGLLWQGVISVGRVLYESGLFAFLEAFRADLTPWSAFGALATLALVGTVSLLMLMRLMDLSPTTIRTGVGNIG
ncbi:MAG: hypothetical protein P8049_06530 [Gemmatimonadota bacterium]